MEACRRMCRSSVPSLALEFLLEAELDRSGATSVALGTLGGKPIASVGAHDGERLLAASTARLEGVPDHVNARPFASESFSISVVELGREQLLLASVGGAELSTLVEAGVRRILKAA
ncbi:MAG: hypothetical protein U0271_44720 [Polyangiaceae bacterium]